MNEKVIVGKFGAPFGIRGWIKVISFTDPLSNILNYQPWFMQSKGTQDWQVISVEQQKIHGQNVIIKLKQCNDVNSAAAYTHREIAIERDQLPKLPSGEYYWSELKDLQVINKKNEILGVVESLFATGANDILVVVGDRQRLIPYIKDVILSVNLQEKKIIVDWDSDF